VKLDEFEFDDDFQYIRNEDLGDEDDDSGESSEDYRRNQKLQYVNLDLSKGRFLVV
jgi:hypothetical protein